MKTALISFLNIHRRAIVALLLLITPIVLLTSGWTASATDGDPQLFTLGASGLIPRADFLTCPTLPAQPSQADQGAMTYCLVCMTCHGDVGQGLAAFLGKLDAASNCYQSKCHAANHPPWGFQLPTQVPPVVGPGMVEVFGNALRLHDYLVKTMPWQNPGSLSDDEYWNLTAFMLRANGYDPDGIVLDANSAAQFVLGTGSAPAQVATPTPTAPSTPAAIPMHHDTPLPGMMRRVNPLTCPTLPPQPDQADEGAITYCLVCMTCHGDVGQGLEEFRKTLDPADQNCWKSKCHAANHPPDGFVLPTLVPAIVGPHVLEGFGNALNLHNFLKAVMPYQAPGSLSDADYWELTAFVMRMNGYELGNAVLDEKTAAQIVFPPSGIKTPTPAGISNFNLTSAWPYLAFFLVLAGAGTAVWIARLARRR